MVPCVHIVRLFRDCSALHPRETTQGTELRSTCQAWLHAMILVLSVPCNVKKWQPPCPGCCVSSCHIRLSSFHLERYCWLMLHVANAEAEACRFMSEAHDAQKGLPCAKLCRSDLRVLCLRALCRHMGLRTSHHRPTLPERLDAVEPFIRSLFEDDGPFCYAL